jgi:hypothetical protein
MSRVTYGVQKVENHGDVSKRSEAGLYPCQSYRHLESVIEKEARLDDWLRGANFGCS